MMKILLGTKSDLIAEREVSQKEGEKLAKNNGFHYFETSAKEGTNVDQLFQSIANHLFKIYKTIGFETSNSVNMNDTIRLDDNKKGKNKKRKKKKKGKGGCC